MSLYTAPTWVNGQAPAINAARLNALCQAVQEDGLEIQALQQQQASPYNYKGVAATVSALPASGNTINDTYYVTAEGCLYTWNGSAWSQSSIGYTEVEADLEKINANIASEYSASALYEAGDYCTYGGQLYICTTAIETAMAWDADYWEAAALADTVSETAAKAKCALLIDEDGLFYVEED